MNEISKEEIELILQERYFSNPKNSQTELEISGILQPKFQEYVQCDEFIGHSEVEMKIQLEDLLELINEEDFKEILFDKPEIIIPSIEYTMHHVALITSAIPEQLVDCRCYVRIKIPKPTHSIKELKASTIGKLICIQGTVIKASSIKPYLLSMKFQCNNCKTEKEITFRDGKYVLPKKCSSCNSQSFIPLRHTVKITETQRIRIQEIDEGEGRIPRSIECELVHELVNTCVPGDTVILSGILKRNEIHQRVFSKRNKDQTIYEPFISVNHIENCRSDVERKEIIEFTENDMKFIENIKLKHHLFRLLVHSLCPPIYGHYIVKAALLLILFGGTRKEIEGKLRPDSHLLIVGDPGLGKSQMLRAIANVVPRGVYVSGSSTTKTGLTVSLHRYAGTSDFTLESGALVLGDQGVCCIDEFDKMEKSDYSSLLEAMEQQSISIAKAGICCTLPARTSVITAANPIEGHFNKAKTIAQNIDMPSPLLSRFDLIFVLVDNPDAETDKKLSEHIIKLHKGSTQTQRKYDQFMSQNSLLSQNPYYSQKTSYSQQTQFTTGRISLREYLSDHKNESNDPLPPRLFRKYLTYAKTHIHPKLNQEAKDEIQKFYIELRQTYKEDENTPVTTRQLESLIRLTEAKAKSELRKIATKDDALDVIEIFKIANLTGLGGISNVPMMDFRQFNTQGNKKQVIKQFYSILKNECKKRNSSVLTKSELQSLADTFSISDIWSLIDSLNNEGVVLKQSNGYKIL